jgi:hypothetical protein
VKTNLEQYRSWASGCPHLPVFFQPWWLDAVCPGTWDVCLHKDEGGKIIGVLPYFLTRKWSLSAIEMPPLTPYLGPWYDFPDNLKLTNRYALEHSTQEALLVQLPSCVFFRQRWHPQLVNALPFRWNGFRLEIKYTYCLNLGERDLYADFASALRNNINNAAKKHQVERSTSGAGFYAMNGHAFAAQNMKMPYSEAQFQRLSDQAQQHQVQDFYWAIEKDSEKKIAAIHIVKDQRYAYLLATGRTPDAHSGAVALLIWQALQDLATEGIQVFDFEGSSLRGVEGFFRQFGGELKMGLVLRKGNPFFRFPELTNRILRK